MSLKVIELNDNALRVGDESGILLQSPGFALAREKSGLILGNAAMQQARIHPTRSFNKYWHELSMDPVTHVEGIRHYADIAFAHLGHLAEECEINDEVIFAIPGNFTRQHLAILLGLASHSPFTVRGMVDTAIAAATSIQPATMVYAEMQLHQVVLTKIVAKDGQLNRESVIQVPGVGSQNFMDLMMQLVTDLFIQQCRFNPQHDAESEQQLYNALPLWLEQDSDDQSSLLLELTANTSVRTAKMPRENLVSNLSRYYKSIAQSVAELATAEGCKLLLSPEFAGLPGFRSSLGKGIELELVTAEQISQAVFIHRNNIERDDENMQLVLSLPSGHSASVQKQEQPSTAVNGKGAATHLLIGSKAVPLGSLQLPEQLGRIEKHKDSFYLDSGEQEFLLNRTKVAGRHQIHLGDLIQSQEGSEAIQLIQVNNG